MGNPLFRKIGCLSAIVLLAFSSLLISRLPPSNERARLINSSVEDKTESGQLGDATVCSAQCLPYKSYHDKGEEKEAKEWFWSEKEMPWRNREEMLETNTDFLSNPDDTQIADDIPLLSNGDIPDHEVRVTLEALDFIELGDTMLLNTTVVNEGKNNETNLTLQLFINGTEVNSYLIPELANFTGQIFMYPWTPALEGFHNITVYVAPVAGETNTNNNVVTEYAEVKEIKELILWDTRHGNFWAGYFSMWLEELYYQGYKTEYTPAGYITTDLLSQYDIFISAQAEYSYSGTELAAIESFVRFGGGLLVIGDNNPSIYNSLTQFAGVSWTSGGYGGNCTDITPYEVTQNVLSTYFNSPDSMLQVFGGAISLIRDSNGDIMLAASHHGHGRILSIADENSITNSFIEREDNFQLALNMIEWLLDGQLAHELVVELKAPSSLSPGDSTLVNATVWNCGLDNESNVVLQLFIDEIEVDSISILNLVNGTSQTLSFLFTTSSEDRFNVTAYAAPAPNENVTSNNVVTKAISVRFLNDYFMLEDSRWYDAETNGINLNFIGDDIYTSVDIPFYFPFYDEYFNIIYVSSNGWLSFGNTAPYRYWGLDLPSSDPDFSYAIAPFFADLIAQDNIFLWLTNDWVVIQYSNYEYLNGQFIGTFQVVLHTDGLIEFNYLEIVNAGSGTVGLNYGNGILYNSFSFDDLVAIDFSLLFFHQQPDHELEVSLDAPAFLKTGSTAIINATVTNLGLSDETYVDLRIYINNMLSNHTIIDNLSTLSAYTLRHYWQPIIDETYNITVFAIPLLDEASIGNNAVTEYVYLRDISGRILYDQIHTNVFHVTDYSLLFDVLEDLGIIVDILITGTITSTLLGGYDLLICSAPEAAYSSSELAAIEEYVLNGGGLLQISPTYLNIANTLTQFAGIFYQGGDVESTVMTNITEHEITRGVKSIFMSFSHGDIQTTSEAIDLIRAPDGRVILACAEPAGRVVSLTPRYALHELAPHNPGGIEFVDNLLLGVNIFAWLLWSNTPPSSPILHFPGLLTTAHEFLVSWDVSTDSDGAVVEYILQMSWDSSFHYIEREWTVNTTTQAVNVTEDDTYYFRVCARDNQYAPSEWSDIVRFTVYTDPWLGHFLLIIGFSSLLGVGLAARFWPRGRVSRKKKL